MKIIAIDHGNTHIKTSHRIFKSGLNVHQKNPSCGDCIKWNDKYYTLTDQRINYMEDKTKSKDFFVLSLFAIAKELTYSKDYEPNMEIILSVGLPPEHMFDEEKKTSWGKYFTKDGRKVNFEYNGKPYSITISNVQVYPQGYSVVFLNPKLYEPLSKAYIVDIGGYTIDVMTLHNGKMDTSLIRSLGMGMITFYNLAQNRVKQDTGIDADEDIINDFLKNGTSPRKDVTESLKTAFDEYTRSVINKLKELQIDLRIQNVTFVGGGSVYLKDAIKEASENSKAIQFVTDLRANAQGYEKIVQAKLSKSNRG